MPSPRPRTRWPEPGHTYPDLAAIDTEARPDGPATPIDQLPEHAGYWKSRISRGFGPDGKRFYWCQACNTCLPSRNTTFCEPHRKQWAETQRQRRRNPDQKPLLNTHVTQYDMERLITLSTIMQAHRGKVREALAIPKNRAETTSLAQFRVANRDAINGLLQTSDALYDLIRAIALGDRQPPAGV